jgi:lincosamide nucleotidyltransferase A/C/D/E
VLISQLVYRNPPIATARVIETLTALEAAGVRTVLIGGWGIDALVGRQLRPHRDLDLIADCGQLEKAAEVLNGLGYRSWHRNSAPDPLGCLELSVAEAFRDQAMRVVELHGADLDLLDSARGTIGGHPVSCLSAERQLEAQDVKEWMPDRRARLRKNVKAVKTTLERSDRSSH